MHQSYVYLVYHKITNQFYYGSRGANARAGRSAQEDFWIYYFTSAPKIKELRKEFGNDSFEFSILYESEDYEECYWHEQKLISENFNNPLSINKHYVDKESGNTMFSMAGKTHSNHTLEKMSSVKIGNTYGSGRKGKKYGPQTKESNEKRSQSLLGRTPWNKGLPATNKGKPKPKYQCSCCGKIVGGLATLNRWHESNCKLYQFKCSSAF